MTARARWLLTGLVLVVLEVAAGALWLRGDEPAHAATPSEPTGVDPGRQAAATTATTIMSSSAGPIRRNVGDRVTGGTPRYRTGSYPPGFHG